MNIGALIDYLGIGPTLLIPHTIAFLIAMRIWMFKDVSGGFWQVLFDLIGAACSIVAFLFFLIFLFDKESSAGTGSAGSWFLIYSIVTLGVVPFLTHVIFFLSGRFVGKIFKWRRLRKMKANFGRAASSEAF